MLKKVRLLSAKPSSLMTTTNVEELSLAAKSRVWVTRLEVAKNIETPAEILLHLTSDPKVQVREAVAMNPKATIEVLSRLILCKQRRIHRAVLKSPNVDHDIRIAIRGQRVRNILDTIVDFFFV